MKVYAQEAWRKPLEDIFQAFENPTQLLKETVNELMFFENDR